MNLPKIVAVATAGLILSAAAASAEAPTNKLESNKGGTAKLGTTLKPAKTLSSTTQFATGTASTVPQATKGNLQK